MSGVLLDRDTCASLLLLRVGLLFSRVVITQTFAAAAPPRSLFCDSFVREVTTHVITEGPNDAAHLYLRRRIGAPSAAAHPRVVLLGGSSSPND